MKNSVTLIGHVGNDAKFQTYENGQASNFSLATNENYKNQNGDTVEKTEWHNVVAFGKTAEIVSKYVKKGNLIAVSGKLRYRNYEKDGQTHYVTEIVVRELTFLNSKNNSEIVEEEFEPVQEEKNTKSKKTKKQS